MFPHNETDHRFVADRMEPTETVCDNCGEVILESELRFSHTFKSTPVVWCEKCEDHAQEAHRAL